MRMFIVLCSMGVSFSALADWTSDGERCAQPGNGEEVISACTRAIASGKLPATELAGTYYNRGIKWRAKDDKDRAIADFGEAIRLNPQFAEAYNNRGAAWQAKGDNDRAIADYGEAIRLNPQIVGAYNNRALAWQAKGDNDRAIADYGETIRLNPQYAEAYNNRALVWQAKGDNDRAIADYGEAVRLNPQFADAYSNRGYAWKTKGDNDHAIADYGEAIRLNPQHVNAYNALAWLLATSPEAKVRDGKRAVQLAQKAGKLTSSNWADQFDTLAAAYAEAGQFANAVRSQEKALGFPDFEKRSGTAARKRLSLYRSGKPYREYQGAISAAPAAATNAPAAPAAQSPTPAAAPHVPAAPVKVPKYNDLITAVMLQDEEAVRDLLDFGKWIDIKNESGFTPVILAAKLGDLKITQLLLARGADSNHRNHARLSALDYARQNHDDRMVSLLRNYGARDK